MTSNFILVYIAVIFGVATYFYLRKSLREWRERREAHRKSIPRIFYVYRMSHIDADSNFYLHSVHMSMKEAEESYRAVKFDPENLSQSHYGIRSEPMKRLRKEDA